MLLCQHMDPTQGAASSDRQYCTAEAAHNSYVNWGKKTLAKTMLKA